MILPLSETERVIDLSDGYQTERRCRKAGRCEWRPIAYHGTLCDAASADAQRKIRSLPNDDPTAFVSDAERIIAAVTQIFNRALESGQSISS